MNPEYEFLTNQWKELIAQPRLRIENDEYQNSEPGLHRKLFGWLGDAMISGGTWLKKTSKSQVDDRSVAFHTRN